MFISFKEYFAQQNGGKGIKNLTELDIKVFFLFF